MFPFESGSASVEPLDPLAVVQFLLSRRRVKSTVGTSVRDIEMVMMMNSAPKRVLTEGTS